MPQTRVVAERVSQPKKNRCEFLTNLRGDVYFSYLSKGLRFLRSISSSSNWRAFVNAVATSPAGTVTKPIPNVNTKW